MISEEELTGGATNEEYNQMQQYYMDSSQNATIEQALKLADKPYKMEFKGVYVMSVENIEFLWQAFSWRYSNKVDGKAFKVQKHLWIM